MSKFSFKTNGVCSHEISFEIENGIVMDVRFTAGCNGNLNGIGRLVNGMKVEEVIEKLSGIKCGMKETSCPDQLAKALIMAKKQ